MLVFDEIKLFLKMICGFVSCGFFTWALVFLFHDLEAGLFITLLFIVFGSFLTGFGYLMRFVKVAAAAKKVKEEKARETTPEAQRANLRGNIIFDIIRLEHPDMNLRPQSQHSKSELKDFDIDPRLLEMDISDLKSLRERLRSETPSELQENITVAYSTVSKLKTVAIAVSLAIVLFVMLNVDTDVHDVFALVITVFSLLASIYLVLYLIIVKRDRLEIRGENLTFKGGFKRLVKFTPDDIKHVNHFTAVSSGGIGTPSRIIIELLDGTRVGFCVYQDGYTTLRKHLTAYIPNRFVIWK